MNINTVVKNGSDNNSFAIGDGDGMNEGFVPQIVIE